MWWGPGAARTFSRIKRLSPLLVVQPAAQSQRQLQYPDSTSHCTKALNSTTIRGVFKKRPNFLNSAPTSKESARRLLSAPSFRFWQQTAICPVSLWALVVELHPLNWERAQAVRRISDKVTMKELEERARVCVCVCVCVCVKFCCKLGKNWDVC